MKSLAHFFPLVCLPLLAGCVSSDSAASASTPIPPAGTTAQNSPPARTPNWEEIDKTVQRVKAREQQKSRLVETSRSTEQGFFPMSDADYAAALDSARADIRKANPKWSDSAVETEAVKRADAAKSSAEHSPSSRASSTFELQKP